MTLSAHPRLQDKLFIEILCNRHSVRDYTPDNPDADTIQTLLDAAVRAPTAKHEEPWAFVVIQNRETLKALSEIAKPILYERLAKSGGQAANRFADPEFNIFHNAGTLIVICGKGPAPYVPADCWLAAENLMLTASALGLGTCVIGSAAETLNLPQVKDQLNITAEFQAIAPIIVGKPREAGLPGTRKPPQILSWK
jgi:nitroreductase